jgi:TPP-dependent trihydroxycyclohexane-1,2-dione (THcHDO) dehydratase
LVRFVAKQFVERDGQQNRFIEGFWGIFGHGNVSGLGQGLVEYAEEEGFRFYRPQNEQGMVHISAAFAKHRNRLSTFACTTSIGPGALNMMTGAGVATVNRLPVLLLPSNYFANRVPDPVLQQIEHPNERDVSANDAFRPVSRFFDRISRPEQLIASLPEAFRILTDPAETGAATICLPEDVQAEAFDWRIEFFEKRVWHVRRPLPEPELIKAIVGRLQKAENPIIITGGGTIYSEAWSELKTFAEEFGIAVAETQAGKGALSWNHPYNAGPIGSNGGNAANELATQSDFILALGTRLTDFTTASKSQFQNPKVQFVGINVAPMDASKMGALPGELLRLWRPEDPKAYRLEYGFSCMGYEIPGGIGVKLAEPEWEVVVMIGDGTYLMMNSEIVTAVAEGIKRTVVVVDNHGYQCTLGVQRICGIADFGNELRFRDKKSGALTGGYVPIDFRMHAEAMGAHGVFAPTAAEISKAVSEASKRDGVTVIVAPVDPEKRMPGLGTWWDVPVAGVSRNDLTRKTRENYVKATKNQRAVLV